MRIMKRLPDWLGIGCVKCGTSWTWAQLRKHPEIYVPRKKEVNFFNYTSIFDQPHYESYFTGASDSQSIGEWTPDYFHHYEAMYNIKEMLPNIKMVVIFRHPIERAFSNYKHAVFEKRLRKTRSFADSWTFWRVSQRSIYHKHLKMWYKIFDKDQIKIMWYDDIKTRPVEFMQEIFKYIGVNDKFIPRNYDKKFRFKYHNDEYINSLKLNDKDRKEWLERYLPHTEELEQMTGRDLSSWKV